jgi:hypothetical protein
MSNGDLELQTLCNHLWESANILRGPVDAADFKTYIFPLLFFRLNRMRTSGHCSLVRAIRKADGCASVSGTGANRARD